jgi:hypothetical protein
MKTSSFKRIRNNRVPSARQRPSKHLPAYTRDNVFSMLSVRKGYKGQRMSFAVSLN